jgi:catechol 2,3-dioxygenase-like lactoylglutathione lyase family enzyme
VLGLRLVKITVNFDDPDSYRLCYGDGHGRPGAILTFFAWPGARRRRLGTGKVTPASFAVPIGSLAFWKGTLGREWRHFRRAASCQPSSPSTDSTAQHFRNEILTELRCCSPRLWASVWPGASRTESATNLHTCMRAWQDERYLSPSYQVGTIRHIAFRTPANPGPTPVQLP